MANTKACLVLLVLAVSSAAMAAAFDLAALEEEKFSLPNPLLDPGRIFQCWAPIMGIDGCIRDVFSAFLSFFNHPHLSPECCAAIMAIDENCLHNIFARPPFNLFFPPLLKVFCAGDPSVTSPPPTSSPAKA